MNLPAGATLSDFEPTPASFLDAVLDGLSANPKSLPCQFFYDARGSELFEQISETEEYYPTRTEIGIIREHGTQIAELIDGPCELIEFGCGSSKKIRVLMNSVDIARYVPIDISKAALIDLAYDLAREAPGLRVAAVCADYNEPLRLPEDEDGTPERRVGFFPGSTIGNFSPDDAIGFLVRTRNILGPSATMIVGVDLQKDEDVLLRAYDDARGITAQFNKNLLRRINRELDGTFDLDAFDHRVLYNRDLHRIEMHLRSRADQEVRIAGRVFSFARGETVHTENSYKYSPEGFRSLAERSGYNLVKSWMDENRLFSLHFLRGSD